MPDSPVITAANDYRASLLRKDAAALQRLTTAYGRIYNRLEGLIDALTMQIGEDEPTRGQLVRMERYQQLIAQVTDEITGFQALLGKEMQNAAEFGIKSGERQARELVSMVINGNTALSGRFNVLPTATIETLLGFLAPDSALYTRLQQLAPFTADLVANTITEGVALGYNPRKIARQIQSAFGQGLTSALRFQRTVQIWSYREATRASYVANSDIVEGWYWHAKLATACMSCVSNHGKFFPVSEPLNDHHNGRCAAIPAVRGFPNPIEQTGEQWFNGQSAEFQKQAMGVGKWQAWQDGKFGFDALSTTYDDDVYGQMRSEASLKQILGE